MAKPSQLIAVIIPTHDRKVLVLEALRSVLAQKCPEGWDYRVVVVDDGSRDGTFSAVCEEYGQGGMGGGDIVELTPRLTIMRRENAERGASRNAGAKWAEARFQPDWFLFTDSDDYLAENGLAHLAERVGHAPADDVIGVYGVMNVWDGHQVVDCFPKSPRSPEGYISEAIIRRPVMSIGATLIRAAVFYSMGGFSENRAMSGSEDWLLLVRLAFRGRVLFTPRIIFYYRQHQGNCHNRQSLRSKDLAVKAMLPEVKLHFGNNAESALRLLYLQAEFKKVGALNSQGFWKEASQVLGQTIVRDRMAWADYRAFRLTLSIAKVVINCVTDTFRPAEEALESPPLPSPPSKEKSLPIVATRSTSH